MTKNHMKARAAPRTWNIARKECAFTTRPNPGSQRLELTLPLALVLRSMGVGSTKKELNYILRASPVLVNGVRRWDLRFGVGFMDTISIPEAKQYAVLTLDSQGRLVVESTTEALAGTKLAQVRGIVTVIGGKRQLSLTDGRTLFVTEKDAKQYARGSTVAVSVPAGSIASVHPVAVKAHVILTSGKHRGKRGTIDSLDGDSVTVATPSGSVNTKAAFAYVLAKNVAGGI